VTADMKKTIVCGTDFSPEAEGALAWAAAMARREGCDVSLVFAIRQVSEGASLVAFEAEQIGFDTRRLRASADAAAHELGVSIQPQILRGEPHQVILQHAREVDARMIVLGTGGQSIGERLMLGSVAERTVRSADRVVVLVPRGSATDVWRTAGAAAAARPPRVVAGLGDGDDAAILHFVAGLRRAGPCDTTLVHLYWPMEEYTRLGLQGARDLFKADPDVIRNLEPALRAKAASVPGEGVVAIDIRPAWGEPASNLLVAAEDRKADLLVVGAHDRHGLGRLLTTSIAQRLARKAHDAPVAVVPAMVEAQLPRVPTLRTVLAVTDLSPLANAAVPHAYALVRASGGVVELCYVCEHALPAPAYAYDAPGPRLTDVERARLVKELRDLIPADASYLGIATHVSIVDGGKAAEAIVQAAERLDVDAIAMASHGRGGLARTVLGSVAQEVVHRAHRPVYVVRGR
jgi:nucleotide-binding universal stress UspA family protein